MYVKTFSELHHSASEITKPNHKKYHTVVHFDTVQSHSAEYCELYGYINKVIWGKKKQKSPNIGPIREV